MYIHGIMHNIYFPVMFLLYTHNIYFLVMQVAEAPPGEEIYDVSVYDMMRRKKPAPSAPPDAPPPVLRQGRGADRGLLPRDAVSSPRGG